MWTWLDLAGAYDVSLFFVNCVFVCFGWTWLVGDCFSLFFFGFLWVF